MDETTATMAGETTADADDTGATTTAEGDAPGFTVVAAIVALLGAALVAARRR